MGWLSFANRRPPVGVLEKIPANDLPHPAYAIPTRQKNFRESRRSGIANPFLPSRYQRDTLPLREAPGYGDTLRCAYSDLFRRIAAKLVPNSFLRRHFLRLASSLHLFRGANPGWTIQRPSDRSGGCPAVKAQRAMGHAHLVFFGSGRLLWPSTRIDVHSLALHELLYYNSRAPGDGQTDRRCSGSRADGSARGPYLLTARSCSTVENGKLFGLRSGLLNEQIGLL